MSFPLPDVVEAQVAATNEATKSAERVWIGFLLIAMYLLISVMGTTHEQLLLNGEVKFPILNGGVPCYLFYILAPLLLIALHFNLLLEEYFLAAKVSRLQELGRQLTFPSLDLAQRLTSLATSIAVGWRPTWYVRGVMHLLFVVANMALPVFLLVFMQITFLPFHSLGVSRLHRVLVVVDLLAIGLFLHGIGKPRENRMAIQTISDSPSGRIKRFRYIVLFCFSAVLVAALSLFRIVVPVGEPPTPCGDSRDLFTAMIKTHLDLRGKSVANAGYAANHEDAVHAAALGRDASRRDLRCADFRSTRLANFDFRGADLTGARFDNAHLEGADFSSVTSPVVVNKGSSDVGETRHRDTNDRDDDNDQEMAHCDTNDIDTSDRANLRYASFDGAWLDGANLRYARLDEARFQRASLENANFNSAKADWADFTRAHGKEVNFTGACLRGALFKYANLSYAKLPNAHVELANWSQAHAELAEFGGTVLIGSDLTDASLQGASGLSLEAVDLRRAKLYGIDICPAQEKTEGTRGPAARGSEAPLGVAPNEVRYVDLRSADFRELPKGGLRTEVVKRVKEVMRKRNAVACSQEAESRLLYDEGQDVGNGRRLSQMPPNEDEFYQKLTHSLVDDHTELLRPILPKAVARLVQNNVDPTKFDTMVVCRIYEIYRHPFAGLSNGEMRTLDETAKTCPARSFDPNAVNARAHPTPPSKRKIR